MKWLDKLLGHEDHSHFTARDYLKHHPKMHPTDAEALAKLNQIIAKNHPQPYDWMDQEGDLHWSDEGEE